MDRHRATKNSPAYRADPCHNRRHDEPPVAVSRAADHLVAASSVSASSCQKPGSISVIVTFALFTMLISVMLTRARFFRGYSAKPIASVSRFCHRKPILDVIDPNEKIWTRTTRQWWLASDRFGKRPIPVAKERTGGNAEPRSVAAEMIECMIARTNPDRLREPGKPIIVGEYTRHWGVPYTDAAGNVLNYRPNTFVTGIDYVF